MPWALKNQYYNFYSGRNFRSAGGTSDQCSVKAWANKIVLSLDLKNRQTVADQNCMWQRVPDRKCWKSESTSVLVNRWTSRGWQMNAKLGCRHVQWFGNIGKPEWTCSELCTSELTICMRSAAGPATNAACRPWYLSARHSMAARRPGCWLLSQPCHCSWLFPAPLWMAAAGLLPQKVGLVPYKARIGRPFCWGNSPRDCSWRLTTGHVIGSRPSTESEGDIKSLHKAHNYEVK